MTNHRFFLPPDIFNQKEIEFPTPVARQIASVLRLKSGQTVSILDNLGNIRDVVLNEISRQRVMGTGNIVLPAGGEPRAHLILCPAITQREKFELILQKGCELGVKEFRPILTSRTLAQDKLGWEGKLSRWHKILQEAAEQCGRGQVPEIFPPEALENVIKDFADSPGLILHEKAKTKWDIQSIKSMESAVTLFIGPEGGFSEEEVTFSTEKGLVPVSIGDRVLRMETAAIAACVIFMTAAGEMGDFVNSD